MSLRSKLANLAILLCLLGGSASAQVAISGPLSDATTGPLLAGTVYHAGVINVPAGGTLTVQAGAIVKFNINTWFDNYGTLDCQGTAGSPVVFTDIKDDTAGGDTNGDGPSSGVPGHWLAMFVRGGSSTTLDYTEVRFAGRSGYGGIDFQGPASPTIANSTVRDCANAGIDLHNQTASPVVTGCTIQDCLGTAVQNARLDSVPGFANNTASGNAGDYIRVTSASLVGDVTIGPESALGGALVFNTVVTVNLGTTLTLAAGVVCKMQSALWWDNYGTLDCQGTAGSPVVFTDVKDDTAGGDTNGDGLSSGVPGHWIAMLPKNGSSTMLDYTEVRFAGGSGGGFGGIDLSQPSNPTIANSTVRDCSGAGLNLQNSASFPLVTGCTIQDCLGTAVQNARLDSVPGFANNTASGNAGDYIQVTSASLVGDVTIGPDSVLGGALVFNTVVTVNLGTTLTLEAGVVCKMQSALWWDNYGTLDCQGTAGSPVIFTDVKDDTAGGDTNGDGPSSGVPGHWLAMFVRGGSSTTLDYTEVRFAGGSGGGFGGIDFQGPASPTIANSTVRDCAGAGIDLHNQTASPLVTGCTIQDCLGTAVQNARLDSVSGFANNTASGNAGDYIRVTSASLVGDVTIGPDSVLGGALVFNTHVTVNPGTTLTLNEGVVCKMQLLGGQWVINGSLDLIGSTVQPVVLTELADDEWGGDTNGDGNATLPSKGFWVGIFYSSGADASNPREALIRYAGRAGYPGLTCSAPLLNAQGVRVEHCAGDGIEVDEHSGDPLNWIAYDCDGYGIDILAGNYDLRHATVHDCGAGGIRVAGGFTGTVVDSISWDNTGANYVGFVAGRLRYSDGDPALAGANGIIDLDPLFVDAPAGDLHLQQTSPGIDAGDPFSPPDPDGTRADMGAYPNDRYQPRSYCTAKTSARGCIALMSTTGSASLSNLAPFTITASPAGNDKNGVFFYGLNGPQNTPFIGGTMCVRGPWRRTPIQSSGGNPPPADDCSGSFAIDFNLYMSFGLNPGLVAGAQVNGQYWFRDPFDPFQLGLSDAIQFAIAP